MNKHYSMPALALSVLTACNSGGSGDDAKLTENPTPAAILTGSFIDSPVEGLRYETPSQSGLTNSSTSGRTAVPRLRLVSVTRS